MAENKTTIKAIPRRMGFADVALENTYVNNVHNGGKFGVFGINCVNGVNCIIKVFDIFCIHFEKR